MPSLRTNTRVLLSFHTWSENGFGGGRRGSFVPGVFRIVGMSTQKSFGAPAGNFTLRLKPEPGGNPSSLLDLWKEPEGVWVYIWIQLNGQIFDVMLGNIDTVTEEFSRSGDGTRTVNFTVTGRDIGKVFAETELFINIHERSGFVPAIPLYRALAEEIQFTPAQIIDTLVREWVGNDGLSDSQWQLPPSLYGGQSFYAALNRSTIDPTTRGNAQELTILQPDQQGQKLWDAIQTYANPVLNEMWVDLAHDPGSFASGENRLLGPSAPIDPVTGKSIPLPSVKSLRPALYLRERPFISSEFNHLKWDRLPTHELRPDQIVAGQLAKGSSAERFNYWELVGASAQTRSINFIARVREQQDATVAGDGRIGNPGTVPIFNLTSIRRYGLRRFQQASRFFPVNDATLQELATGMIPRWLRLLHDWYSPAVREVTGTITTSYIMPWIRIGHRIKLRTYSGSIITFYVEGVQHEYTYPQNGFTTLTLTRGEAEGQEILREIYEELRDAPRSTDDVEDAVPGMQLTEDQARAFREESRDTASAVASGELGATSTRDPATAVDETGQPVGGETLLASTAEERTQGDSQMADTSMNFADTPPRTDPSAGGVEGIDDNSNAPPEPTEDADPLEGIDDAAGETVPLDEDARVQSAGASIPEVPEG